MQLPAWKSLNPLATRRRLAGAGLLLVLLVGLVWWMAPRRVSGVMTVDGAHRWRTSGAPVRWQFVWAPAEDLGPLFPDELAKGEFGPLHVTDGGRTLLFAWRDAAGSFDLFQATLAEGRWQAVAPLAAINSPARETAPCLSQNGQELFFSSDRDGGQGGWDIYFSKRTASGWSAPENLGPKVNTAANEFEAALTPDGAGLIVSSDRSPNAESNQSESTADLYWAFRESPQQAWAVREPVPGVNLPQSNERWPCLAAAGGRLYFASDRATVGRRTWNFDLYAARFSAGAASDAESLGSGVNTLADEIAPHLSAEQTALAFARSEGEDVPGRAFQSRLVEVVPHVVWDTSRWQAIRGVWWKAALVTLLAAGVGALVYYRGGWLFETASMARFLFASLLLHLVIIWLMLLVPLSQEIVDRLEEIRVSEAAVEWADDNLHQSHEAGDEAYEKVADLRSMEPVRVSQVNRQIAVPLNVPLAGDMPAPTLPAQDALRLPPNRLIFVPPPRAEPPPVTAELARSQLDVRPAPAEPELEAEPPPEVAMPTEQALEEQVAVARAAAAEVADAQMLPREAPRIRPEPVELAAEMLPEDAELMETPTAEPRDVQRAPVPLASDQLSPEAEMPRIAGTPAEVSPLPVVQTVVSRAPDTQPSPRKLETVAPRIAAARDAGPLAPAEMTQPGMAADPALPAVQRDARTVVSPAAEKPEEVLLVAAEKAPGLPEMAADKKQLQLPRAVEDPTPAPSKGAPLAADGLSRPQVMLDPAQPLAIAPDLAMEGEAVARSEVAAESPAALPPAEQPELPAAMPLAQQSAIERPLELARTDSPGVDLPALLPDEISGPSDPFKHKVEIGTLAEEAVEAAPSASPLATQLTREPAKATPVAYAEDNVGMQAMFALRQGDTRREFIELVGGTDQSEAAVQLGLNWMAQHQYTDGHWSLNLLDPPEKNLPASTGAGNVNSDTAATGLGLLPFLGSGHTHQEGAYQLTVTAAVKWMVEHQKPDGDLFVGPAGGAHMYSHGIASIALCEVYGLSQDPALRDPAQRALNFIVAAQHQGTGGWRYTPGEPGDTSVVGWQVMALKSGEMAGLVVPPAALELAGRWLKSAEGAGGALGTFGYQGPGGSPAMTAEGLLCRQFLGSRRDDPSMRAGAEYLRNNLPQPGRETSYYWYYGTQVMYHMQGDYWTAWNEHLRDTVVNTQVKDGHQAGTWNPADNWEQAGGRLYTTSLRLLMLQVYYRHLPLYRQLD